jgi:hypothetical protein
MFWMSLRKRNHLLLAFLGVLLITLISIHMLAAEGLAPLGKSAQTGDNTTTARPPSELEQIKPVVYLSMGLLLIIIVGGLFYMMVLQWKFLLVCKEEKQLALYMQSPAGLPSGTVRAMIAILTVTVSLFLAMLYFFKLAGTDTKFPEVLSSLMGAVIGFYFGSRAGGKETDEGLQAEVKDLKVQRDQATTEKESVQTEDVLGKINKGIAMSKTVALFLPKEVREKHDAVIARLEQGVAVAQSLTQAGDLKGALGKSKELLDLFKGSNPAKDVFTQALTAFGTVLGGSVPALAIISTVVAVGTKLVGTAYEKWRTRVLNAPFFPSVIPLNVVDANTGFLLLRLSPIFKKAFARELEANDREFMGEVLSLLKQDAADPVWSKYGDRFASLAEFEQGVAEFRQAAADMDLDPALFAEAGGKEAFLQSLQQINANEESKAALHQLVTVVEGLQQKGEPVLSIFDKVRKEAGL